MHFGDVPVFYWEEIRIPLKIKKEKDLCYFLMCEWEEVKREGPSILGFPCSAGKCGEVGRAKFR